MQIQTYEQPGNLSTWAADINAAHADAVKHASSAIDYAKHAGELLLKVKQKLPHGAFGEWLVANCSVSERQARRYMAEAQGKPSHLKWTPGVHFSERGQIGHRVRFGSARNTCTKTNPDHCGDACL